MSETTRQHRTVEERVKEIDDKILSYKHKISNLEHRKQEILNPKPRISKAKQFRLIMEKAKESGMSNEEIAKKLGIKID